MDDIDRQILTLLAQDARASLKTLSAQVGCHRRAHRKGCGGWRKAA